MSLLLSLMISFFTFVGPSSKAVADSGGNFPVCADIVVNNNSGYAKSNTGRIRRKPPTKTEESLLKMGLPERMLELLTLASGGFSPTHYISNDVGLRLFGFSNGLSLTLNGKERLNRVSVFNPVAGREDQAEKSALRGQLESFAITNRLAISASVDILSVDLNSSSEGYPLPEKSQTQVYLDFAEEFLLPLAPASAQ